MHLTRHADKQECLLLMLRKLYALVQGRCQEDNQDALANHELLLPGHLFGMILKERVENWLEKVQGTEGPREGGGGGGEKGNVHVARRGSREGGLLSLVGGGVF